MNSLSVISGPLAIRLTLLPDYRARLFDLLAPRFERGVHVLAARPAARDSIVTTDALHAARLTWATNRHRFGGPLALVRQPELMEWLESVDPEVLVTDSNPRLVDTRVAINWMHARGRAVLGWGLGTLQLTPGFSRIREFVRNRHLRGFDGLIAYGSVAAKQFVAAGFPEERIRIAHNAAVGPPDGDPPQRPLVLDRPARVLFIGRLIPGKRLEDLINACASMPDPRPQLVIVGDGPLRGVYEGVAAAVLPETRFLGDLRGAALEAVCRDADLFVLPGRGGLAIQEAMRYGLPVICTYADGTERDLVEPANGWQFEEGDVGAITRLMAAALADLPRLRAMGDASCALIRDRINLQTMAMEFVAAAVELGGPASEVRRRQVG